MENITIEVSKEQIISAYAKAVDEILNKSTYFYDNPIKKAVEVSLKEKQLEINTLVGKIFNEVISSKEFKEKITGMVMFGVLKDLDKLKK